MASKIAKRIRLLSGMAIGAGAMYFLDPRSGRSRRAQTRDQLQSRVRRAERESERQSRYLAGVEEGLRHQGGPAHPPADSQALEDRIRSELGHSFPHDRVSMDVVEGVVELRGQLAEPAEIEDLIIAVLAVPDVTEVLSLLHLPGQPAPNKAAARRASRDAASGT